MKRISIIAILVALKLFETSTEAASAWIDRSDLFAAGSGGYAVYHIPGVVVTAKGTVLAWCEARNPGGDWGNNEFLLRRSTDDGKTFGPVLHLPAVEGSKQKNPAAFRLSNTKASDITYNNAVLIAGRDGTVHLIFCLEYERCFYARSVDDGVSWSNPVEITSAFEGFRSQYAWKVIATGPDHGIQLQSGRLLIPVWMSLGTGAGAHRPSITSTIYSDDGGTTWCGGAVAVPNSQTWVNPNETTAAQLADGTVMLNVRTESKANRRLVTTSATGIGPWTSPYFDEQLKEPVCMGSLARFSLESDGGRNRLLFVNPDNLEKEGDQAAMPGSNRDRKNLTVKLSYDEGKTWAVSRVIDSGWSAYSDVSVSPRGTILVFYGSGGGKTNRTTGTRLTMVRFNLEWLTNGNDTTPGPSAAGK